jgi:hypothetical protein
MVVSKKNLVKKIQDYLNQRITLDQLVAWAENVMSEADFEEKYFDEIRDIVAKIGLADVRAFGLTWEECENFLSRLGYRAQIEITEV